MEKLVNLANVLRSKNSGPFQITLDILFDNPEAYFRVANSGIISSETICRLYGLKVQDICGIIFFEQALGIKITYNRAVASGTYCDRDVYGAQQHAPLMGLMIP